MQRYVARNSLLMVFVSILIFVICGCSPLFDIALREKINALVDFPVKGFDLSAYMAQTNSGNQL